MKLTKTPLPARKQVILGRLWNSIDKRVQTAPAKVAKYRGKIAKMMCEKVTSRKKIESLHGCLRYVADVEPFGIPFLTPLIKLAGTCPEEKRSCDMIPTPKLVKRLLCVWDRILELNKGISMAFILQELPRSRHAIFVDASTSWGIGGYYTEHFFATPWRDLRNFNTDIIARMELFACLVAVFCFRKYIKNKLVVLYTDNTNARD